jgi:hypothetical protein
MSEKRVNVATDTVIELMDRGAGKIDAIDAVSYRANLTDQEVSDVARKVNDIMEPDRPDPHVVRPITPITP